MVKILLLFFGLKIGWSKNIQKKIVFLRVKKSDPNPMDLFKLKAKERSLEKNFISFKYKENNRIKSLDIFFKLLKKC